MSESERIAIAKLEQQNAFILNYIDEQKCINESMIRKLEGINGSLIKLGAEREADAVFLEHSIKKHVTNEIKKLSDYHNEDLKPIKDNILIRLGNNYKLLILIAVIFVFSFWNQIDNVVHNYTEKQGLKYQDYGYPILLRGETINDSIK